MFYANRRKAVALPLALSLVVSFLKKMQGCGGRTVCAAIARCGALRSEAPCVVHAHLIRLTELEEQIAKHATNGFYHVRRNTDVIASRHTRGLCC